MGAKVVVKNNDLDEAIRNFKRASSEDEKLKKRKQYYLKPGLKRKEKQKLAAKKKFKFNKKKRSNTDFATQRTNRVNNKPVGNQETQVSEKIEANTTAKTTTTTSAAVE